MDNQTIPSFDERAKESANKSTMTLQSRWITRITLTFLLLFTSVSGIAMIVAVKMNPFINDPLGLVVGGAFLLVAFLVIAIAWAAAAFCCGHLWCCTRD